MRTITFIVNVPKNITIGHVKQKVHDMFTAPLYATRQKIKDIARKAYKKREILFGMSALESGDEKHIRAHEEQEKVTEGKEFFRAIERVRDLEFA